GRRRGGLGLQRGCRSGAIGRRGGDWGDPPTLSWRAAWAADAEWMSGKSRARLAPVLTKASSGMSDRRAYGSPRFGAGRSRHETGGPPRGGPPSRPLRVAVACAVGYPPGERWASRAGEFLGSEPRGATGFPAPKGTPEPTRHQSLGARDGASLGVNIRVGEAADTQGVGSPSPDYNPPP